MSDVSDDGETSSIADSPTRSETSSSFSSTVTQSNKPAKKESKAVHHQTVKQEPKSIANNDLTTSGNYKLLSTV